MCAGNDKLSGLCDLIQGLTTTPTAEQLQMIYGEYLNDFIKNPFEIDGMGVVVNKQKVKSGKNYDNFLLGKHETFCHVVSRNIDNSKKRTFDPNRANKVHWIKPILENSNDKRIKYFEGQNSKAQWCRFYWYKERSYIVILKEISCDLLLVTGYCVDLSEIDKFNKQWQNYEDQENIAKKTYLEGRYATLGNAIGSIFSSRHILYPLGTDAANIQISFLKRKLLAENYV